MFVVFFIEKGKRKPSDADEENRSVHSPPMNPMSSVHHGKEKEKAKIMVDYFSKCFCIANLICITQGDKPVVLKQRLLV